MSSTQLTHSRPVTHFTLTVPVHSPSDAKLVPWSRPVSMASTSVLSLSLWPGRKGSVCLSSVVWSFCKPQKVPANSDHDGVDLTHIAPLPRAPIRAPTAKAFRLAPSFFPSSFHRPSHNFSHTVQLSYPDTPPTIQYPQVTQVQYLPDLARPIQAPRLHHSTLNPRSRTDSTIQMRDAILAPQGYLTTGKNGTHPTAARPVGEILSSVSELDSTERSPRS